MFAAKVFAIWKTTAALRRSPKIEDGALELFLATVPPLPPRRSDLSEEPEFDQSFCLRLDIEGSASGYPAFREDLAVSCGAAQSLAHHSKNSLVDGLQPHRIPFRLPSKLRESDSFPGKTGSCGTCSPCRDAQYWSRQTRRGRGPYKNTLRTRRHRRREREGFALKRVDSDRYVCNAYYAVRIARDKVAAYLIGCARESAEFV